jgi:hypothetical protein
VNDGSNDVAKSNAERQKAYRDRKRGGPPKGRWHGHETAAREAAELGDSRTVWYMKLWLYDHVDEEKLEPLLEEKAPGSVLVGTERGEGARERRAEGSGDPVEDEGRRGQRGRA